MLELLNVLLYLAAFMMILVSLTIGGGLIAILWVRVPFAPTPKRNVDIILDHLDLKKGDKFYDLGCGEGRFLIAAEKRGASSVGFEVSPWAYFRARINILLNHSNARVIYKNFYYANLSDADAVYCFLIDNVMAKVEKKLRAELKPGAQIVCYGFKLPTWQPVKITDLKPRDKKSSKIYLYQK